MSDPQDLSPDSATTLGVPTSPEGARELSARMAGDAVRRVHALEGVPADAVVDPHPDAKVPGANVVDVRDSRSATHPRYWVGMAGEVIATTTDDPAVGRNPEVRRARTRYTAAVEAVRLRFKVPVSTPLLATPDAFVDGAFFVHETADDPQVRWVCPDGGVHDGYQLVDGHPEWEPGTTAARRDALRAQPSTAALVDAAD
ncbi:hypothetical protein [Quadrisphaera sp. INWT6]|uniref:hypothetical protein n=1 Tax=Quadrisphaera sp. INWT6 TaxID=2596917 RepID=UPI001891FC45|nr:hypothetical protein [Quadrisphaera sp. INWT6]MBF5083043.1 hypothetical protein [Quadrisphaera sp. INWT6]